MRFIPFLVFFVLSLLGVFSVSAQDFSNKGKEFYLCFPAHVPSSNGGLATLSLFITSDKASSGTITMANGAFSGTFNIAANGIQEIPISWAANIHIGNSESNTVIKKSIKVKVDAGKPPVVVYAQLWAGARSAATLVLPTNVLGKQYYAVAFNQAGGNTFIPPSTTYVPRSQFQVIATKDNTEIKITPMKNGVRGNPITVTLPFAGDMYQYQSTDGSASSQDLTGSYIESVASSSGGCNPIAVFSGSSSLQIGTASPSCNGSSQDPLWQQVYPVSTWGKSFGFVPFLDYPNGVPYRVMASEPNTAVFINGTQVATLNAGEIFPNSYTGGATVLSAPSYITANKPICVTQYSQSENCSGLSPNPIGDPDMVVLNPIEQNINDVILFSSTKQAITRRYINVLMKTVGTANFKINGVAPTATWQPFTALPGYSYLRQQLTATGSFRLQADSGFNCIAYGFGDFESYAYSAGTNVKDLFQFISVGNQFSTANLPKTCINTPLRIGMVFPYQPTQIQWVFGSALNAMGLNDTTLLNPVFDSTWDVSGRTLYRYRLPRTYTVTTLGTYTVKIIAINPTPDGCGNTQEIEQELEVMSRPVADFTVNDVCEGNNVQFTDASNTNGRPFAGFYWDFGDNTTGATFNPSYLYAAPGNYNPRYSIRTDIGCLSDTVTKPLNVYPKPIASITPATVNICQGAPDPQLTITGASGTAPYTFTYTQTGVATPQQIISTGNIATLLASTSAIGTYTYALTNVSDASPLNCSRSLTGSSVVTISPKPTGATISGPPAVCLNGTPPTITLTGQGGTGEYVFTYNINNGTDQVITSTSGVATLSLPTNAAGSFTYNLVSVEDPSSNLCKTNVNAAITVMVNPLPTASIASSTLSVCQNATSPTITFTGANGTAPYTFEYRIDGGVIQQAVSGANGIATLTVLTGTPGIINYTLVSVKDASSTQCTQVQSGDVSVTINPLPTASIAGTTIVCQNAPSPNITFTGSIGTAPYTFAYTINNGPTETVTTSSGNSVNVVVPTSTSGTFTYNLVSVTDASNTTCTNSISGATAVVTVNPLPTATISGSINVCQNANAPSITFTGGVGPAPYTFTYNIDGGPSQPVTTVSGNSVTVQVPTGTPGTFTYNLISVTDASTTVCSQNQSGSVSVLVYPLPTANFTTLTPRCETGIISFTDQSAANAGNITGWSWNFDDPTSGTNNTSNFPSPQHVFATAGTYNVSLTVTTNNGCVSVNPPVPVVIHAKPLAGFINPEVCLADTYAQFNDTSSVTLPSTIVGWNWNFGDPGSGVNNTSNLPSPQHSYLAVGSYSVELIVTSNNGCKDTVNQNMFVSASNPVSNFLINNTNNLCANDSISITDAATVLPGLITKVEIFWDDAGQPTVFETDQNPTPGKIYKHKYPNFQSPLSKTYNIRYRAYSGGVCSNDKVIPITINAAPLVQFNPIPAICLDIPQYQITQASETGGVPGTLLFTGPGVTPSGLFTPATAGAGTHNIKYYFTSTAGGCIDSAMQTIKVWQPPTADFTISSPLCERQSVTFTSTSTSTEGNITEWRWDFGDGTPLQIRNNANPVQHTYGTFGTFTVKLNVVTSNGCVSVAKTMTVDIKPLARPNFTFPPVSCLPNAIIPFTNTSSIPDGTQASFTYLWNFGDPGSGPVNTSPAPSPSHTYSALGPYNVNLQVTTGAGCVHDTTIILTTLHPQPIASFTTDKIDVCIGGSIQFNSTSNGADGTITQWVWDMDNGDTRDQPAFNYTYSTVGVYNVRHHIINSFNCRSTTATTAVSINPYPIANAGPDKLMLEGGQTQLTPVNNNTMPITVRWLPSSFLSDSTVLSPIARPPDDITYTFVITTDKGCSAQDQVFVKVLKTPIVPNIFSPNGDGVHDTWIIPYLDSYPGCTVEVVNRYGQVVFRSVGYPTPWDGRVNGNPVPVGTYYYVIDPKNGRKRVAGYVDVIR